MPENLCEYTFVVHTALACPHSANVGVECHVDGFHDLVAFQRMPGRSIQVRGRGTLFLSVCDPLGATVPNCKPGSAACLLNSTG